jgi:hypothetical protein
MSNCSPLLFLGVAFTLGAATASGQSPAPSSEYIAFRVDAERVVATHFMKDVEGPQVREGTWVIAGSFIPHRQMFEATVEQPVGGYLGCQPAVGVLLRVIPQHRDMFRAVRPRYFVATPARAETPPSATDHSAVRTLPASTVAPEIRRSIELILGTTLARELPAVRSKAAPFLARGLTAQYRFDRA